ncbi:MAG: ATPase [Sphingobacteriales bacterium]|nr:MAG: ATPase [Sphingobacteriales bacterium]
MIPPINPEQEIITVRVLDFPKDKVFKAWSDPEQLKAWWGPKGFTNTFETFDFHPGGRWKFVMHGPEKGNYKNEAEFIAIEEPEFIYWKRISQPLFRVCATFEDAGNQNTKLTFRMIFDSVEECEKLKPFVVDKNEENFDKLDDLLKRLYQPKKHEQE